MEMQDVAIRIITVILGWGAILLLVYFLIWLNKIQSKIIPDHKKPFRWWLHKYLCEYGWVVRHKDSYATYSHHLAALCKLGFNLYGDKIK
jgi:hypothetical protein